MSVAELGASIARASRLAANADALVDAVEHRAALAVLEAEDAALQLRTALLWASAAFLAALLAGFALTLTVAAIFWDTPQRVPAMAIMALLDLAACGWSGWMVVRQLDRCRFFLDLRTQLAKDSACLQEIFTTHRD